ncbi:hypothetical protein [Streptomyces sp. NBC_00273]|uniref:hypothetical protein n=1 Tax=Streptomyces sp. NBC_00273 TaxID=2903644 RepID=UPI002E289AA4|nr:hypothetical protein [Streptomyces sp. NBC_00273]
MKVAFDGGWCAAVTREPLRITPRFTTDSVRLVPYASVGERERFVLGTFGSEHWLWDAPDILRFDKDSRALVGAEFQMPYGSLHAENADRVPVVPAVRPGGLRADEVQDFRHEMCTVLHRAPGDTVLTCLRDLDVLDEPLEARIGIAPDVALLVQRGVVVGWSLTDPVRYLTSGYADPDPAPPSPATRRLFTACLDLVTSPLIDEVTDREPAALARLRAVDEALRNQREDRRRVDALSALIGDLMVDHGHR